MRALLCAALAVQVSGWSMACWAATAQTRDSAPIERQSAAEAARAKALKAKARTAEREAAKLKTGLAQVESKANEAKAAAAAAEGEAAALDVRHLADLADQARDRRALDLALVALLQSEAQAREGPPSPEDARAGALAALTVAPLARTVSTRQARLEETARMRAALHDERTALAAMTLRLTQERETTAAQLAEKARLRKTLLAESAQAQQRAAELGRKARTLKELADKASAGTKATKARALSKAFTGPRVAPADGRILIAYGAKTVAGAARGLTIATKPGAKVAAPAAATVVFAGPFRSYGQVVILDPGGGGALVLTGLHSVLAQPGKKVSLGEIIGEMVSDSASTAPELYFEVREAGRTVDPEQWLRIKG